jgi:hypothetical protein
VNVFERLAAWAKQIGLLRTLAAQRKLLSLRQGLFNEAVGGLANQLRAGEISLIDWQSAMKREIKDLHVTAAVIGNGGEWNTMTPSMWGKVGARTKGQYRYLGRFADDIAKQVGEEQGLTSAINARAKMYGGAADGTFNKISQSIEIEKGRTEVIWVLTAAEHCVNCVELAGKGWMPIEELGDITPGSGATQCLTNCKCFLQYR